MDRSNNSGRDGVSGDKVYNRRVELVLILLLDSYSLLEFIFINASRLSFCSILYHLLTI